MWHGLRIPAVVLLLAGLASALASCSEFGFLDDFPEYPPTEPYLENQALLAKRVQAQRIERARREQEHQQRTSDEKVREWQQVQERKEREVAAARDLKARRTRDRSNPRVKAEDLAEWQRIVGH
jgi:hypothetical protein